MGIESFEGRGPGSRLVAGGMAFLYTDIPPAQLPFRHLRDGGRDEPSEMLKTAEFHEDRPVVVRETVVVVEGLIDAKARTKPA